MKPIISQRRTSGAARSVACVAALWLAGAVAPGLASAQQVYRIIGADGKVTFSDQPPPPGSNTKASAANAGGAGAATAAGLPFELRQVASKFPVTLYTASGCTGCDSGRALLISRGIPFSERTIATAEDAQALQRLAGEASLPFLTVGGQQIKGYADVEWTQFLDAAGYPKTSILPPSYRRAQPTPLVAAPAPVSPAAAPAAAQNTAAKPAPQPVVAPNENPAGIKF